MTVCNLGRVFFNGDVFDTPSAVARLANADRGAFLDGLADIKKNIEKIESMFIEKPKRKQRPAETTEEKQKKMAKKK